MRSWSAILFSGLALSACFKVPLAFKAKTTLRGEPSALIEISSEKSQTNIAPSSETLTISLGDNSTLAGTSVAISPGTLAVATDIIVEESANIADTSVIGEMNLAGDIQVTQAANGVIIRPSESVTLAKPLQLSLPLPTLSGLRLSKVNYGLFYKQFDPESNTLLSGFKPVDNIDVKLLFDVTTGKDQIQFKGYFGVYWVVVLNREVLAAEVPAPKASEESILNKMKTPVISSAGIVKETQVVLTQAQPELVWEKPVASYTQAARTVHLSVPNPSRIAVTGCKADFFENASDLSGVTSAVPGLSLASVAVQKATAHSLTGRFRCIDQDGRTTISPWSDPVAVVPYVVTTIKSVTSSTADGNYAAGAKISVDLSFTTAVTVEGASLSAGPSLLLETGSVDRSAVYKSGTDTTQVSFEYTVAAGDETADLTLASQAINLGSAKILDANGVPAQLTLPLPSSAVSLNSQKAIAVDALAPTAPSAVGFASASTQSTSFPVSWVNGTDTNLKQHNLKLCASNDCSTSCSATTAVTVSPVTRTGSYGNSYYACVQAEDSFGNSSAWISSLASLALTSPAPTVLSVSSTSSDSAYKAADAVSIQLQFSEAVHVSNGSSLGLVLETGASDRTAVYSSGTGTQTLTFTYTVVAGDSSADLDVLSTSSLSLGANGAIANASGSNASLTLPEGASAASLSSQKNIAIDTSAPTAPSSVGFAGTVTNLLSIPVSWSASTDPHFQTHNVKLCSSSSCSTGCTSAVSSATSPVSVTGVAGAVYYACVQGQDSLGHISSWSSSGATIAIDTTAPSVTTVSSTQGNGDYSVGVSLPISIQFNESVYVSGSMNLLMETGTTDRYAAYLSGSGTNTLQFTYQVQSGDSSNDLDYQSSSALTLVSGFIRDAAGNDASMTLPSTGSSASLAGQKALVIDTLPPSVYAGADVTGNTASGLSASASGDAVTYSWTKISGPGTATFSNAATLTPAVSASVDGIYTLRLTVADLAGNAAFDDIQLIWDTTGPVFEGVSDLRKNSTTDVSVFWKPADDTVSAPEHITYELCYSSSLGSCSSSFTTAYVIPSNRWEHTVTGLSPGLVYEFVVRAKDALGNATIGPKVRTNNGVAGVSQISSRGDHSCARLIDETVQCWGANDYYQLGDGTKLFRSNAVPVQGLTGVQSVATSTVHSCALMNDSTVKCWGYGYRGELGNGTTSPSPTPVPVTGLGNVSSLAMGDFHSCALLSDGTVKCWGYNDAGQLGDGTQSNRSVPVSVTGLTGVISIAAGKSHTCAVLTDLSVKCWGANNYGQLGDGTTVAKSSPTSVSSLTSVSTLALGEGHSCAISGGGVTCWGNNASGQLGNTSNTSSYTPVTTSALSGVLSIAASGSHSCAVVSGNTAYCWGSNAQGQLGDGTSISKNAPTAVASLSNVQAMTVGASHSCAALANQTVLCWGKNDRNQLGEGSITRRPVPTLVSGLSSSQELAAGATHSCALLTSGTAQCWGSNSYGELGNGTTIRSTSPVAVNSLSGIQKLALGTNHSCALVSNFVYCWGSNTYGQLGDGTTTAQSSPTLVPGLSSVQNIALGVTHSCALLSDGTIKCWGRNNFGQLGNGTVTNSLSPVSVSGIGTASSLATSHDHSCATLSDQTVQCWGSNNYGQLGDGSTSARSTPVAVSGLSAVSSVAVSMLHTCAVMNDATVSCWGYGFRGELGNGSTSPSMTAVVVSGLSNVSALTMGYSHSCALRSDQSVHCWGYNDSGQLGDASIIDSSVPKPIAGLTGVQSVKAGDYHSCAVLSDNSARCWGRNTAGELGSQAWLGHSVVPVNPL